MRKDQVFVESSCGERWLPIAGILRLLLAHHVNHLDPAHDPTGSGHRLESEHGSDPPLDGPVVLLNTIVEIGTLPDADGFQLTPRAIFEPVCGIAGQDGLAVRLAAVDHNPLRSAMPLKSLAQEPLGSGEIAPLAEPELDRVAIAVDRPVQLPPPPADLDVCLINMPFAGDWALAPIELFQQERGIVNRPAMNDRVINRDAALGHHLLEIRRLRL